MQPSSTVQCYAWLSANRRKLTQLRVNCAPQASVEPLLVAYKPPGLIKKIYFRTLTFGDAPFKIDSVWIDKANREEVCLEVHDAVCNLAHSVSNFAGSCCAGYQILPASASVATCGIAAIPQYRPQTTTHCRSGSGGRARRTLRWPSSLLLAWGLCCAWCPRCPTCGWVACTALMSTCLAVAELWLGFHGVHALRQLHNYQQFRHHATSAAHICCTYG